jgi:hypothetical protein
VPRHAFDPSAASRSATSRVGCVDDPEAGDNLLGLEVRAVGDHRRLALAVDDRRGGGRLQSAREDPVALGAEPVVEGVGRGEGLVHLLLGAVGAELVGLGGAVHGQQVVRHRASPRLRTVPVTAVHLHHERPHADTTPCHGRPFLTSWLALVRREGTPGWRQHADRALLVGGSTPTGHSWLGSTNHQCPLGVPRATTSALSAYSGQPPVPSRRTLPACSGLPAAHRGG